MPRTNNHPGAISSVRSIVHAWLAAATRMAWLVDTAHPTQNEKCQQKNNGHCARVRLTVKFEHMSHKRRKQAHTFGHDVVVVVVSVFIVFRYAVSLSQYVTCKLAEVVRQLSPLPPLYLLHLCVRSCTSHKCMARLWHFKHIGRYHLRPPPIPFSAVNPSSPHCPVN